MRHPGGLDERRVDGICAAQHMLPPGDWIANPSMPQSCIGILAWGRLGLSACAWQHAWHSASSDDAMVFPYVTWR